MDELCLRLPEKSLGKEEGAELVSENRTGETRRGNRLRPSKMVVLELRRPGRSIWLVRARRLRKEPRNLEIMLARHGTCAQANSDAFANDNDILRADVTVVDIFAYVEYLLPMLLNVCSWDARLTPI